MGCDICNGDLEPLGWMGNLYYYRCRNCGELQGHLLPIHNEEEVS